MVEFYCDFLKVLLDFYDACIGRNLFCSFDLLDYDSSVVRILVREEYVTIRDMKRSGYLLYMSPTAIICGTTNYSFVTMRNIIKEYKEDSTTCILTHGKNIFPRFLDDFSDEQKQKMLINMIIFMERVQNSVD